MKSENGIFKPKVVLLVEDNRPDVLFLERAMKDIGLDVELHVASDGEKALNFLYKREGSESAPRPSIILLDLSLPRIYGLDVLRVIKSDPHLKRIPVIVLTTSDADEDVEQAYDANANAYIQKPPRYSDIYGIVKSIKEFWIDNVLLVG